MPATCQASELFINQLVQLLMRQRTEFFSTHQDDVERWPVSVMQSKNFAGTSLDAVSGYRRADVLFGENKTKASRSRLCRAGQKQ